MMNWVRISLTLEQAEILERIISTNIIDMKRLFAEHPGLTLENVGLIDKEEIHQIILKSLETYDKENE